MEQIEARLAALEAVLGHDNSAARIASLEAELASLKSTRLPMTKSLTSEEVAAIAKQVVEAHRMQAVSDASEAVLGAMAEPGAMKSFLAAVLDEIKSELRAETKMMVASTSSAHEAIKSEARRKGLAAIDALRTESRNLLLGA